MKHVKEVSKAKLPAVASLPVLKPAKKAASDRRLKRNVVRLRDALDTLLRLRGVVFEYNAVGQDRGCPSGMRMGMIAQDVEKVLPEWVSVAPDGYRELETHGFEALAIEAIRELKAENDELRQELEEVKSLVHDLAKERRSTLAEA